MVEPGLPGVSDHVVWLLHVVAVALLAWRWRARGFAIGLAASLLTILAAEVWPLRGVIHGEHVGTRAVVVLLLVNAALASGASWIVRQSLRAEAAQDALRESEERFRRAFDDAAIAMAIAGLDGHFLRVNQAHCAFLGYTEDELLAMRVGNVVHPDDLARADAWRADLLAGRISSYQTERRYVRKDGGIVWGLVNLALSRDADGQPRYILGQVQDITARQSAEEALAEAEQRFRTLVEQMPALIYINAYDAPHAMLYVSPHTNVLLGYPPAAWTEQPGFVYRICHPDDREALRDENARSEAAGDEFSLEYRLIAADGRVVWVRDECVLVEDGAGKPLFYQGIMVDITDRKQADEALRESEERFRGAFEYATAGISLSTPDGRYRRVNRAFCEMLGYSETELLAMTYEQSTHPDDVAGNRVYRERLLAGAIDNFRIEKRYIHKQGHVVWTLLSVALVRDGRGEPLSVISQAQDITDRKRLEERLTHQAFHDPLTGLPNRALFADRLQHAIAGLGRHAGLLAVMFIDLDGFKAINDALGHAIGDELLIAIAQRLPRWVRATDTVARFGGDEFTVLLDDVHSVDEVTRVATRVIDDLTAPVTVVGRDVVLGASIGIAISDAVDSTPEGLLRAADVALYQAKACGGGCFVVHDRPAHHDTGDAASPLAGYALPLAERAGDDERR
jgi:diguanylate cyclase (GGDEF)-like protein/PAS domain S-box-containing protein